MSEQVETLTHWKQLVDTRFLGVYSLPNGQDLTLTIRHAEKKMVTVGSGKSENLMHVWFEEEEKALICNKTNGKIIEGLYGWAWQKWVGKRITLYAATTKMGRETVDCLRVREKVPPPAVPTEILSEARLTAALDKIARGEFSAQALRARFALTEDQLARVATAEAAQGAQ
jgi:hypothetical protein